ncbi:hypothetical protein LSTR_LSTR003794 [Laodelphax striatellus]|uniref:Uncharacterized protein n=1 Tax=Laodelphax striatellus TaxID=195883 RepID=A0A482XE38_LAOST|nr:hypothetical protein LSTR_LSTR003794 [Laodelphax striatellus]
MWKETSSLGIRIIISILSCFERSTDKREKVDFHGDGKKSGCVEGPRGGECGDVCGWRRKTPTEASTNGVKRRLTRMESVCNGPSRRTADAIFEITVDQIAGNGKSCHRA